MIVVGMGSQWNIKSEGLEHYNRMARTYNIQYQEEQIGKYEVVLKASPILENEYVLDLGSGTGLLADIAGSAGFIVGVDFSKNMLKRARRRRNLELICADADHLPFVDGIFDRVYSFTMLQNIPEPKRTLLEIGRVTKIDSEIILSVTRKAYTKEAFLNLLSDGELAVTKLVDNDCLKDYVLFCKRL